jgi:hypothetical protein
MMDGVPEDEADRTLDRPFCIDGVELKTCFFVKWKNISTFYQQSLFKIY